MNTFHRCKALNCFATNFCLFFLQRLQFCLWWILVGQDLESASFFSQTPNLRSLWAIFLRLCLQPLRRIGVVDGPWWKSFLCIDYKSYVYNIYIYILFLKLLYNTHIYIYVYILILILLFYILDHIRYTLCTEWRCLSIYFLCSLSKGWRNSQSLLSPYNSQGVEYKEFWRFCRHGVIKGVGSIGWLIWFKCQNVVWAMSTWRAVSYFRNHDSNVLVLVLVLLLLMLLLPSLLLLHPLHFLRVCSVTISPILGVGNG